MFKIFNLEGLFLSKAKKIISMLLAVAMVLTVAPVNLLASAEDPGYTYGDVSFSNTEFTVDTAATTEVIRVATETGSFSVPAKDVPGTIVKATPSGIPETTGTYASVAYAKETPDYAKIVFKITGKNGVVNLDKEPTVAAPVINGMTADPQTTTTSGNTTTYTWNIIAGTVAAGKDVVFTITYTIAGTAYKAYAFSHVENILVMPGWTGYIRDTNGTGTDSRMAIVMQVQSKNMYTKMNLQKNNGEATEYGKTRGYVNYATTRGMYDADGAARNALLGMGNEENVDSSINAYVSAVPNSAIAGEEVEAFIKWHRDGNESANRYNGCLADDGNLAEPIIYIDKRNENLRSLNMRVTVQAGEAADFKTHTLAGVYFKSSFEGFNDDTSGFSSNLATSIITADNRTSGSSNSATVTLGSGSAGNWNFNQYAMAPISGTGPASSLSETNPYQMIVDVTATCAGEGLAMAGSINLDFRVYDSTVLWNVYYGIINGKAADGEDHYIVPAAWCSANGLTAESGCNADGTYTCYFNKGPNPQASMYTVGFENYLDNLKVAGSRLVTPDITQAELDSAVVSLYVAYSELGGYNQTVNWEINHYLKGTSDPIIPTQTVDPIANDEGVIHGQPQPAGSIWKASCATITGYTCVSAESQNMTLSGQNATESLTFYYEPLVKNLIIETNTDEGAKTEKTQVGTKIYEDSLNHGTKDYYTFLGWYYDDGKWSQPVFSDSVQEGGVRYFTMPAEQTTIYARWESTPIDIQYVPVVVDVDEQGNNVYTKLSTVDRNESVSFAGGATAQFARPDDLYVDGYLFVNFYADENLSTPVSFPLTFTLGETQTPYTIYARMVDVNGRISFESNGGNSVNDIIFTAGQTVNAPTAPTKKGYTFAGWFEKDNVETGTTPDYFADGTQYMPDNTGFIAYAKWIPNNYTISFDLGTQTTEFDTVSLPEITGAADSEILEKDMPATPKKFGYTFHHWELNGERYDLETYPTEDITLTPYWVESDTSAFIKLNAYEKLSGNYVETSTAQVEDVVTFRMISQTNFYNGSSLFVFMYDKDFFELVDTDDAAFKLNKDSEYISGINATAIGTTTDSLLPWPSSLAAVRNDYNAMMVAIDPQVTSTNYKTVPMGDGKWIVEFQLKVKQTATGTGKVYMSNEWTRTPDNIMGTMFYGWSSEATEIYNTYNNMVTPDLDLAVAEISIDSTVTPDTSVKLLANGGAYASTTENFKTYTGRAETEIMDYEAPTKTGYTLTGWTKVSDGSVVDWVDEFYYPTADNTATVEYNANWEANMYPVTFFTDETLSTQYYKLEYAYDSDVTGPPAAPTKKGYTFKVWVNADTGAETTLPYKCDGEASFYPTYTPNTNTPYTIKIHYIDNQNGTEKTFNSSKTGTTGYNVVIDSVAGTAPNTIYYTPETLPTLTGYEFDPDNTNNTLPKSGVIDPEVNLVLEVYYKASIVTITLDANGGSFADGETTATISGEFQTLIEEADLPAVPTRTGYTFGGYQGITIGTSRFVPDRTYKAQWTANSHTITFDAGIGAYADGTTSKTKTVAFGGALAAPEVPSKEGYTFLGWKTADGSAMPATLTVDEDVTYTASFEKTPYDVNYYIDGVLDETRSEIKYIGDSVTIASEPTKYGYDFSGWKLSDDTYAENFTMGSADVDIYGEFTAKELDITFDANGGSWTVDGAKVESMAVKNTFDATIDNFPTNNPTRDGHSFLGWAATEADAEAKNIITSWPTLTTEDAVTYYAVWKAEIWKYNVEFYYQDVNGQYGEAAADESIELSGQVGSTVSYNAEDNKTGFTLDTLNSELSGTVSVEDPLVLKVKYARNQHTLTIDIDGTKTPSTVYYGAAVNVPSNPEKTGYTFDGWSGYTEGMTMPDTDLTITALFTAKQFTVTYYNDKDKTSTAYTRTAAYGSDYTVPTPTKEGHTFAKWLVVGTDADSGLIPTDTTQIPLNGAEYYATWTVNNYNLVYLANGGSWSDGNNKTFETAYGTAQADWQKPADPERAGYEFSGWNMANAPATMPAERVNVLATWTAESYNVIFKDADSVDAEGNPVEGEIYSEETLAYGAGVSIPEPEKEGHTFLYWTDADGNEVTPMDTMEDIGNTGATVTYIAVWDADEHVITFVDTGDVAYAEIRQDYGTEIADVADPVKTGYTFTGWDIDIPDTMPAEDLTITANWKINQYTITFVDTGDVAYEKITKNYKEAVGAVADPVKTGYTFKGWDKDIPDTMPAENMTITANWEINQYTFKFEVDGGSAVADIKQDYATAVTAPTSSKTGYDFKGWALKANATEADKVELPATMPAENRTYYAIWVIKQYTITFNVDGGTPITPITQDYGTPIDKDAISTTKEGYNFAGWDKNIPATMPAEDMTITAQWTINTYKITFDVDGGTAIAPVEQDYGTAIDATVIKTEKTGYTFDGWVDADGNAASIPATMPAKNMTLKATWKINQYTFTFEVGDGSAVADIKQDYNTAVTAPTSSLDGYTFIGWALNPNPTAADKVELPEKMPAENRTYYAIWEINSYTIIFLNAEGETFFETELDYKETIEAPEGTPDKEFYTFVGWSLTELPLGTADTPVDTTKLIDFENAAPTVIAGDMTIYPAFDRVTVTLTLVAGSTAVVDKERAEDPVTGYIYGLRQKLKVDALTSEYLAVEGDGRLEVQPAKYNRCGTGTEVKVIDNVTEKTVEIYYIIIFGDVNGDSAVDAADISAINAESAGLTTWSQVILKDEEDTQYDYCKILAADIAGIDDGNGDGIDDDGYAGDGHVSVTDSTALNRIVLGYDSLNQTSGKII